MCQAWLDEKVYFLNTETTGLDESAEIVEIAVTDHQGRTIIDTLVKPSVPITPELTAIHGISNEMVANAPTWNELYDELCLKLTGRTIVAYNSDFDARMVRQSCQLYGLPDLHCSWECAMQMYQHHTRHHKWIKLVEAAHQCRIKPQGHAHRALTDVLMTRGVVQRVACAGQYQ